MCSNRTLTWRRYEISIWILVLTWEGSLLTDKLANIRLDNPPSAPQKKQPANKNVQIRNHNFVCFYFRSSIVEQLGEKCVDMYI